MVSIRQTVHRFEFKGVLQMGAALAISAVALLFLGVNSLILWRRTVNGTNSRNDGSGIRTQATKTSDAAWNAGHKAAVPLLRTFGFLDILFALLLATTGRGGLRCGTSVTADYPIPATCGYIRTPARMRLELNRESRGTRSGIRSRWWWSESFPKPPSRDPPV